jgi:hypothetical protein
MEDSLIIVDKNKALSRDTISLPKYGTITEQRVVKDMQAFFKGFDFDENLQITEMFKSVEQIEVFAKEAIKEINSADIQYKMDEIMKSGAIAVRRWYFSWIINKVLSEASYGEGVAKKLAKASGISDAYIYQYKDVGERLSITDVYTLGIYKSSWDVIRQIATIKDEDYRKAVISVYVNNINDVTNEIELSNAKAIIIAAIKKIKEEQKSPERALDMSNPEALLQAASYKEYAPEYDEADKALEKIKSAARKITKQPGYDSTMRAMQDFFLMSDVTDASNLLYAITNKAKETLTLLETLENMIPALKAEVTSIANATLTERE